MSAIAAGFYREGKLRLTNWTYIFWDVLYPLGYLLVFGVGVNAALGSPFAASGVDYNAFFLAGVLGMASFGIASNMSWGLFMDRDNGIYFEMLTYPMSRAEFMGAKVIFNVAVALAQALVTVLAAWWLLGVRIRFDLLPLLFVGVVAGTAGWFFFYAIFAFRIRRNDIFNTVTSIFYFVFLFASSMFYPLEPLPAWFRAIGLINPVTWHVDVLRYSTIGTGDPTQIALEGAAFLVFSAVSFVIAVKSLVRE
jgi:ABC-2 type transport system permease protein